MEVRGDGLRCNPVASDSTRVLAAGVSIDFEAMQEALTLDEKNKVLTQRSMYKEVDNLRMPLQSSVIPLAGLAAGDRQLAAVAVLAGA